MKKFIFNYNKNYQMTIIQIMNKKTVNITQMYKKTI